jgi:hypothetical protein
MSHVDKNSKNNNDKTGQIGTQGDPKTFSP